MSINRLNPEFSQPLISKSDKSDKSDKEEPGFVNPVILGSKTKPDSRKALEELSTAENSKALDISVSSESISKKIKQSLDASTVGGALFNARADLGTGLMLLESARDPQKVADRELSVIATLILLKLCNHKDLLDINVDLGQGRQEFLKNTHVDHPIVQDDSSMIVSFKNKAPIEISFDLSETKPGNIKEVNIKWDELADGPIKITLKEPIDIKQFEQDTLKFILKPKSST